MPDSLLLGRSLGTVSRTDQLSKIIQLCNIYKTNLFQIFFGARFSNDKDDLKRFGDDLILNNLAYVVHSRFSINFCGTKQLFYDSIISVVRDLQTISQVDPSARHLCHGLIIHMSKNTEHHDDSNGPNGPLQKFIDGLLLCCKNSLGGSMILLENGVGYEREIPSSIANLKIIKHAIDSVYPNRLGFCIDTCHLWASGVDLSSNKSIKQYIDLFHQEIGTEHLRVVHLNNSKTSLGSHKDRHAPVETGIIKSEKLIFFLRYLLQKKRSDTPIILETPLDSFEDQVQELEFVRRALTRTNQS